jgi:hypothetical protein
MVAVLALCAAYALFCLVTNPAGPITTPDSSHYLNITPIVPLGYPLLLLITGARGAIIAQPIIFAAALAFMGREIIRTTRQPWLAAAAVAGCMIVPQIREYHASILSESLFLSLVIVFLGLCIRFAHYPTWRLMVLIAITVGVSAVVRRTGFAFVPVMLVMVLAQRHHLHSGFVKASTDRTSDSGGGAFHLRGHTALFFIAALAPFGAIVGGEQAIAPLVHTSAPSSLLGRHLFAKAALIDAAPAPASPDLVRRALDEQLEIRLAPIRDVLAQAPDPVRGVLTIYYETCLQGGCADEARVLTREPDEARQTAVMGAAGMARIRRAPLEFVKLTWRHYRSLWTFNRLRHPDTMPALNQFIAAHRPLPFEEYALSLGPDRTLVFEASPIVRYAQWAFALVGVLTGALAVGGLVAAFGGWRVPPPLLVAGVAALTAHAGLLLTALLAAGFTRFLLGLWPALVVALAFFGWGILHITKEVQKG